MFANSVRTHRRRLGMTQEELAEHSGLNVRSIRKIEKGQTTVARPATVRLLADAFGLTGTERERFCQTAAGEPTDPPTRPNVPTQLPADVSAFTGRAEQLAHLNAVLAGASDQPNAVIISALSGTAGVGKTALAVHWAHRVVQRFPDGQLYVNLRGYDPDRPMAPSDALAKFLTALGIGGLDIPQDLEDRAARFRSVVASKRLLILLDNAGSVEQVRPLLPGSGTCTVVVTSRDNLTGLVAVHGARRLELDLLPLGEAVTLLRRLIGPRVDAEPEAAAMLAGQCARLPLALRIAAELAVSRPRVRLADLVTELDDRGRRLDLLDAGGDPRAAVRSVFSWSIEHLAPDATATFRLLGLHPGPDIDRYAAAALTDTNPEVAGHTLTALTRAHLLHSTGTGRYGMHDLLRAYATDLTQTHDSPATSRSALTRLFDYYLATAATAMNTLHPAEAHRRRHISPPTTPALELTDSAAAQNWLDTERPILVAVAAYTATAGWPTHTSRLSTTLHRYLNGAHHTDALTIHGHAYHAAQQTGDLVGQAQAQSNLAATHGRLARFGLAARHFRQALSLYEQTDDRLGQARVLNNLGVVQDRLGDYRRALDRYNDSLPLYRHAGDRVGEATALNNLGLAEQRLGLYGQAVDHLNTAITLCRQVGDQVGEAHALETLGEVEIRLGHHAPALSRLQQALDLFRRFGHRDDEASTLDSLGSCNLNLGRPVQAVQYHRQALDIFRETGGRDGEASALNSLGTAILAAGRPAEAITYHTAAHTIATDIGIRRQHTHAHAGLGHAHRVLGDTDRARHHYQHALNLYTQLGTPEADHIHAHLTAINEGLNATQSG